MPQLALLVSVSQCTSDQTMNTPTRKKGTCSNEIDHIKSRIDALFSRAEARKVEAENDKRTFVPSPLLRPNSRASSPAQLSALNGDTLTPPALELPPATERLGSPEQTVAVVDSSGDDPDDLPVLPVFSHQPRGSPAHMSLQQKIELEHLALSPQSGLTNCTLAAECTEGEGDPESCDRSLSSEDLAERAATQCCLDETPVLPEGGALEGAGPEQATVQLIPQSSKRLAIDFDDFDEWSYQSPQERWKLNQVEMLPAAVLCVLPAVVHCAAVPVMCLPCAVHYCMLCSSSSFVL